MSASRSLIHRMARADAFRLVDDIGEIHLDFRPLGRRLFVAPPGSTEEQWGEVAASACLALGRIAYVAVSTESQRAQLVGRVALQRFGCFRAERGDSLLVILERSWDFVTPLMHPFFYLGALHEFCVVRDNIVAGRDFVLDERHDGLLRRVGFLSLDEASEGIRAKVEEIKRRVTPTDVGRAAVEVSARRAEVASADGHIGLAGIINEAAMRKIPVGRAEIQIMSGCGFDVVEGLHGKISNEDFVRLQLLYAVKNPEQVRRVSNGSAEAIVGQMPKTRTPAPGWWKTLGDMASRVTGNVQQAGLDEFRPALREMLRQLVATGEHPAVSHLAKRPLEPPRKVVIFILGGVTMAEARVAAEFREGDVVVGGTELLNAQRFVERFL